jgi:DNA-binding NarL/FixJ family response regulator
MDASSDVTGHGRNAVRVLIADDDARVRQALRALIESDPSIVVAGEACSTREVLEFDQTLHPSVILLDLILPNPEDGLSVLRRLAEIRRPVVAISLRSSLRDAALAAGACAFVEKGSSPDVLLSALHEALEAGRNCEWLTDPSTGPDA